MGMVSMISAEIGRTAGHPRPVLALAETVDGGFRGTWQDVIGQE